MNKAPRSIVLVGAILPVWLCGRPAAAFQVQTERFDLPTQPLSIFGLQFTIDYLGPPSGTIVGARAELHYTTSGSLASEDILISFQAPSEGVPVWEISGAELGWSGIGTFHANISTDVLNGVIDLGDPPPDASLFFLAIQAEGFQPLAGQFINSFIEVDILPSEGVPVASTWSLLALVGTMLICAAALVYRRASQPPFASRRAAHNARPD